MILKMRLACSAQPLEINEFKATVTAWSEVLFGKIPRNRIQDAYLAAMEHHKGTYPLSASELLYAWRQIAEREAVAKPQVCSVCGGAGVGPVYDRENDVEVEKPCPQCSRQNVLELRSRPKSA